MWIILLYVITVMLNAISFAVQLDKKNPYYATLNILIIIAFTIILHDKVGEL